MVRSDNYPNTLWKTTKRLKPYIAPTIIKEFTREVSRVWSPFGNLFRLLHGYLALKAGLTVSASIPIAVIAITLVENS